jgi:hypothetical protein
VIARSTALAVAALLAVGLLPACQQDGPTESDLPPEAGLTYPGASQVSRTFRGEGSGRSVDGTDLASAARLSRRLRLPAGVTQGQVFTWYTEQLAPLGWRPDPPAVNAADFSRTVGNRRHVYRVGGGRAPDEVLDAYSVTYSIGLARS